LPWLLERLNKDANQATKKDIEQALTVLVNEGYVEQVKLDTYIVVKQLPEVEIYDGSMGKVRCPNCGKEVSKITSTIPNGTVLIALTSASTPMITILAIEVSSW
jgi:hypothetical protein